MIRKAASLALALTLAAGCSPSLYAQQAKLQKIKPWTVRAIWGSGSPTGSAPSQIYWAPDSKQVTYLDGKNNLREFVVGGATARIVIPASTLNPILNVHLTEQDRDHRNRYGEPDYIWAPDSKQILFDTNGKLWLFNLKDAKGQQVGNTGMESGDNPQFSPNGNYISYIRDNDVFVQPAHDGSHARALTHTGSPTVLNGDIDWVYLEELNVRSNYFWSPDSKKIAYMHMNEQHVPLYPIEDWIPVHAHIQWWQRYPQPGDPNPEVRVGVVRVAGGPTRWLNIPISEGNDYIPRFGWVNSNVVWVETLDRAQKHENIYFANVNTGAVKLALAQTEPKYFNDVYTVTFLKNGQFLVLSWRDGHTHIYRYSYDMVDPMAAPAHLLNEVEQGDYEVESIQSVDDATGNIYYISNQGNPALRQIWAVNLDGSHKHLVSKFTGVHHPKFPPHGSSYIDKYSNRSTPPAVAFCNPQGVCHPFWKSRPITGRDLHPPVLLTLTAADGHTTLYGTLMLPQGHQPEHSVPLIVNPYGGPAVGTATDSWGGKGFFWDELLTEHGFAVLHVDNRGMGGRGRAFEQVCYHNFGPPELADQLASIDQVLARYPELDPHRLGWWGWSWGGTFTLYALSHSDRFRVGVSVAPVTSWQDYDSIYTERYMGLPSEDAAAYKTDSVQNSAADIHGHLLIAGGTGDDNVHLENTIQYIQKLIDAGIPYDYNLFPRKTHSIAGPTARTELFQRILAEFEMYLEPAQPVPVKWD